MIFDFYNGLRPYSLSFKFFDSNSFAPCFSFCELPYPSSSFLSTSIPLRLTSAVQDLKIDSTSSSRVRFKYSISSFVFRYETGSTNLLITSSCTLMILLDWMLSSFNETNILLNDDGSCLIKLFYKLRVCILFKMLE